MTIGYCCPACCSTWARNERRPCRHLMNPEDVHGFVHEPQQLGWEKDTLFVYEWTRRYHIAALSQKKVSLRLQAFLGPEEGSGSTHHV